jgi:hypothetical protein
MRLSLSSMLRRPTPLALPRTVVDPFLARGRACLALPAWASWKVRSHSPPRP